MQITLHKSSWWPQGGERSGPETTGECSGPETNAWESGRGTLGGEENQGLSPPSGENKQQSLPTQEQCLEIYKLQVKYGTCLLTAVQQVCQRGSEKLPDSSQVTQQVNGKSPECKLRVPTLPLITPYQGPPRFLSQQNREWNLGGPVNISHRHWRCSNHTLFYVSLILQARNG